MRNKRIGKKNYFVLDSAKSRTPKLIPGPVNDISPNIPINPLQLKYFSRFFCQITSYICRYIINRHWSTIDD